MNEHLGDSLADSHSGRETIHTGPSEQSGQSGQSEHSGQSGQSGQPEHPGQSGQSGQSEYSEECGQSGQSEFSGQSGQSEHCHSGQSGSDEERTVSDPHPPRSSESTSAESRRAVPDPVTAVPRPVGLQRTVSDPHLPRSSESTSAESQRAVPDPVTAVPRPVGLQSPARDLQRDPKSGSAEDHRNEPCLFHSYQGCLKGDQCEYSHLIHADQIQILGPKTRRGHAVLRIKRRVAHWLSTADLYLVHHELQEEARKDPDAKDCEKSLEYGISLG